MKTYNLPVGKNDPVDLIDTTVERSFVFILDNNLCQLIQSHIIG